VARGGWCSVPLLPLFKVFIDEAHMSGSEIDDGTDKATAWKRRLDIIILKLKKDKGQAEDQPRDE
jgi:hypothetical protein